MKENKSMMDVLFRTVLNCKTMEDCADLFADLCTYQEIEQMAQRAAAAKLITEGKTYAEIIELTGISSATLSRVSKSVHRGNGGYARLLPGSESHSTH